MKEIINNQKGQLTLMVLIFGAVAIILLSGFIIWADVSLKAAYRSQDKNLALQIAESGIEYYRWHLIHNPNDFQDGTREAGPYSHDFFDKEGNKIGNFILDITPPEPGSTVVTIKSTGKVDQNPGVEKIVEVKLSLSGILKFAAVLNSDVYFGPGTEVFGPIHSNGGVHFDGIAHNIVTSTRDVYNDPDHSGNVEFGVHTHVSPADPEPSVSVPLRPDVFMAGRQFPVPAIDFSTLTVDLADIKASAQAFGNYIEPSNDEGYHIILKTDDTFDLYKVTSVVPIPNGCVTVLGEQDWGTWSINQQQFIQNYPIPQSGLIFVEDNIWVDGQINTAFIVIASGIFPENSSKYGHITVNNNILYTNYDGSDILGLIAQGNFNAGWVSEDELRIDAALIAQHGRVGRYYYRPPSGNQDRCAPHHIKTKITLYGMMASNDRYGFAFTDGTGYQEREIIYDPHLLFNPPPGFPTVPDRYQLISWKEIK